MVTGQKQDFREINEEMIEEIIKESMTGLKHVPVDGWQRIIGVGAGDAVCAFLQLSERGVHQAGHDQVPALQAEEQGRHLVPLRSSPHHVTLKLLTIGTFRAGVHDAHSLLALVCQHHFHTLFSQYF